MALFRRNSEDKSIENRLRALTDELARVGDRVESLRRAQRELDAEMASLWEKVSHALSRLGGRTRKAEKEQKEEERPLLVENPLARRLMGGR